MGKQTKGAAAGELMIDRLHEHLLEAGAEFLETLHVLGHRALAVRMLRMTAEALGPRLAESLQAIAAELSVDLNATDCYATEFAARGRALREALDAGDLAAARAALASVVSLMESNGQRLFEPRPELH
jgi:hypothetical protein